MNIFLSNMSVCGGGGSAYHSFLSLLMGFRYLPFFVEGLLLSLAPSVKYSEGLMCVKFCFSDQYFVCQLSYFW